MTLREIIRSAIDPALCLLPDRMDTAPAALIMLAICGQEADFRYRRQLGNGPARGLWQFELAGGVRGVLTHPASRESAYALCAARGVAPVATVVHPALEVDDVLAAGFARLLLWTDPWRLPAAGDVEGAWQLYLRTWRPGAYTRGTPAERAELRVRWGRYYAQAAAEVSP